MSSQGPLGQLAGGVSDPHPALTCIITCGDGVGSGSQASETYRQPTGSFPPLAVAFSQDS